MGLAASQARLLSLTARIHDVEYQAQMIQSAKLQLALQEDEVYRKYNEALDEQRLVYKVGTDKEVPANFNNLFGVASFTNGTNSKFVLYDRDERLVVPDEIAEAYENVAEEGTIDPYVFAMYMMTGQSIDKITKTENSIINNMQTGKQLPENIEEKEVLIKNIITNTIYDIYDKHQGELGADNDKDRTIGGMESAALSGDWENFMESYFSTFDLSEEEKDSLNTLHEAVDSYRTQVYYKYSDNIYQTLENDENAKLDMDKYRGYLRYAQMIAREGGIDCCTKESEYGVDFGTNSNVLNDLLLSGYATMDEVDFNLKTGKLSDEKTSVATNTTLEYVGLNKVDPAAYKKAEAEYENAMKKISRQDKKYDMELNKLETERSALTTEYDSVKKVISDNIERSFKIFS